ncbi:DUF6894 family protein [Methylobacterium sp. M6A4_1b]
MPRFFFDVTDTSSMRDEEGMEFPGPSEAVEEAKKFLPLVASEEAPGGGDIQRFSLTVRDETGRAIYSAVVSFTGTWLAT